MKVFFYLHLGTQGIHVLINAIVGFSFCINIVLSSALLSTLIDVLFFPLKVPLVGILHNLIYLGNSNYHINS